MVTLLHAVTLGLIKIWEQLKEVSTCTQFWRETDNQSYRKADFESYQTLLKE